MYRAYTALGFWGLGGYRIDWFWAFKVYKAYRAF